MSKFKDILQSFPVSYEEALILIKRFESLPEAARVFLESNPSKFKTIEEIQSYIEEQKLKEKEGINPLTLKTNSFITEESYSTVSRAINVIKVAYWIFIVIIFFALGVSKGFSSDFWGEIIGSSFFALIVYVQILLMEVYVNTAKNTGKTNVLLDINNQLLQKLLKQKE